MKQVRIGLLAAVAAASLPTVARAQVAAAAKTAQPPCPCDQPGFTPKTSKAQAVQQFREAMRTLKVTESIGGTVALFALMAHDGNTAAAAQQSYEDAFSKMIAARGRAETLGGLQVKSAGGDVERDAITYKLVPGVDYDLKP